MPRFPGVALVPLAYPWLFSQHASGVQDSWPRDVAAGQVIG